MRHTFICLHCGGIFRCNPCLKKKQEYCSAKQCKQARRSARKKERYKKDRIKHKRVNPSHTTRTEGKVLMRVSTFFNTQRWLIITVIDGTLYSGISGTVYSGLVACLQMKIEHENLHRNATKNHLLYPAADHHHRRVVS